MENYINQLFFLQYYVEKIHQMHQIQLTIVMVLFPITY